MAQRVEQVQVSDRLTKSLYPVEFDQSEAELRAAWIDGDVADVDDPSRPVRIVALRNP